MRPFYPYPLWQKASKAPLSPSHTKKGPGRKHKQGRVKFPPGFFL